jgi:hypothetical protein
MKYVALLFLFLAMVTSAVADGIFNRGSFGVGSSEGIYSPGSLAPRILLTNLTFPPNSSAGTVIGTLSVFNGIGGTYTFTFTSNPGALFQIVSNSLQVLSGTIGAGSYPVIIHAVNGASIIDTPFTLVAAAACSVTGQMDFSVCSNVAITAAVMP